MLIYTWLSKFESRSLDQIKASCASINEMMELQLANPIWDIFWPLVFNGIADHAGNGYYALTPSICLDFQDHYYYINCVKKNRMKETNMVGILYSEEDFSEELHIKKIKSDPVSILKSFPTLDEVVDQFPTTLQDNEGLYFYNYKTKQGIAKLERDGLTRYFSIPSNGYIRQLPSRTVNPEAFSIAYCYSRVINKEDCGVYLSSAKRLIMPSFAMPFMIYRLLLIDGMKQSQIPQTCKDTYIFESVSIALFKEINRIFCNSLRYE